MKEETEKVRLAVYYEIINDRVFPPEEIEASVKHLNSTCGVWRATASMMILRGDKRDYHLWIPEHLRADYSGPGCGIAQLAQFQKNSNLDDCVLSLFKWHVGDIIVELGKNFSSTPKHIQFIYALFGNRYERIYPQMKAK